MSGAAFGFNAFLLTLTSLLTMAPTLVILMMHDMEKSPKTVVVYQEDHEEHPIAPRFTLSAPSSTPTALVSTTTETHIFQPKSPFLYDLKNFNYIIEPTACTNNLLAVISVNSRNDHVEIRNAQRRVYPNALLSNLGLRRVFLLAAPNKGSQQAAIDDESRLFKDILQGNFIDAYRNLTYKTTMGLLWTYRKCRDADFIAKVDDDIAVNVLMLANQLRDELKIGVCRMSGALLADTHPFRDPDSKWFLTKEEYPGDTFPDYLNGWIFFGPTIMFGEIAEYASENIPYLFIDDLVITGIAREKVFANKTVLHDIGQFIFWSTEKMECCISKPNVGCYFLAGSVGLDAPLMKRFLRHAVGCSKPNACSPAPNPEQLQC